MGQKLMSPNQALELLAQIARRMPILDSTTAQGWIDNPEALGKLLSQLAPPNKGTYIERFDAPQQNTEATLPFLPYRSHYDLWDYTSEPQNIFYCEQKQDDPDTIHVKLFDFGRGISHIDDARALALAEGYRLVSGQWSLAFRRMFPRPGRISVVFGGDEVYWEQQGYSEKLYLTLDPRNPHGWIPGVIKSSQLFDTHFLWAATPILP